MKTRITTVAAVTAALAVAAPAAASAAPSRMRHAAATRTVFLPHPCPTWITPSDQAVAARRPALARGKKWGSARIQTHAVAPLARAARKRT